MPNKSHPISQQERLFLLYIAFAVRKRVDDGGLAFAAAKATAVATCHRHVAKSRLSSPPFIKKYPSPVGDGYFWWSIASQIRTEGGEELVQLERLAADLSKRDFKPITEFLDCYRSGIPAFPVQDAFHRLGKRIKRSYHPAENQ